LATRMSQALHHQPLLLWHRFPQSCPAQPSFGLAMIFICLLVAQPNLELLVTSPNFLQVLLNETYSFNLIAVAL
jgi:hypothetical protein